MPLDVNLVLGLQLINIVEQSVVALDVEIWSANGLTSDHILEMYNKEQNINKDIVLNDIQLADITNNSETLEQQIKDIRLESPESFSKTNGKYVQTDTKAR